MLAAVKERVKLADIEDEKLSILVNKKGGLLRPFLL